MKKSILPLLLATVLFLGACAGQQTEKLPQWVLPFVESSHSMLPRDKEILNRDFSSILADRRVGLIGYMGADYQKMEMTFQRVKKESDTTYLISGFSRVSGNTQPFSGSLHVLDVRELNEYEYGPDDFMKGQIGKQGICIARYSFGEEVQRGDAGVFSGISLFRWYTDQSGGLHYDDINEDSDNYSNNLFAGSWQSGSGGKTAKCAWGHYRIPDCGDLDIGAAEFAVNPRYAANGWENPEARRWYGYYSAEIDLPYAGEETEAGFVTYGLEIQAGECTYYKSQLHANDRYACKVIAATEDSIALEAVGQYAPDTEGKPLATLYRKNGRFYLSGPFVFDADGHTTVECYPGGSSAGESMFPPAGSADSCFGSSVRRDTLLVEDKKTAVFIVPADEEINRMKLRCRSVEDFYVLADDAAFYSSEAETYLKQNGIKIVYADTTCRVLDFAGSAYIDLSDTVKIGNPLFNVVLYNGYLPAIVLAAEVKAEAPGFFGLPVSDSVDKKTGEPGSAAAPFRIAVPNDLDSMALLKKSIAELKKPDFQGKTSVTVYDSVYLDGLFIGKGIPSSVKLYKRLLPAGNIKVMLFAYLRECHNDSYPALELQTFDREDRFIDRLLVSTSIFEEGGLYRYAEMDENGKISVTDVVVDYDRENDTEEVNTTVSGYVIDGKGKFVRK